MKNKLARVAASCLALAAACAIAAHADEGGRFYGMLRSRDLSPFGFLRLDMRPAHAINIEEHTFAFEATSVLILVAMVGAVVLARREGSDQ